MYLCIHVLYIYTCIYIYIYIYMYTHIHVHVYIYIYIYTHTCTYTLLREARQLGSPASKSKTLDSLEAAMEGKFVRTISLSLSLYIYLYMCIYIYIYDVRIYIYIYVLEREREIERKREREKEREREREIQKLIGDLGAPLLAVFAWLKHIRSFLPCTGIGYYNHHTILRIYTRTYTQVCRFQEFYKYTGIGLG